MTQDSNHKIDLDTAIRATRADVPTTEQLRDGAERVWQKMQASPMLARDAQIEKIAGCDDIRMLIPALQAGTLPESRQILVEAHLRECVACRRRAQHQASDENVRWAAPLAPRRFAFRMPAFAMTAAAVVVIAIAAFVVNNIYFAIPAGARATVQSLDGVAYRVTADGARVIVAGDAIQDGETVRTGAGAHAYVRLSDGSVVELNERSEFTPTARGRNMTVVLDQGAVIVQAAKRTSGHLYVKTPDCRVAVTGTIFSVNAGVKGSRVSVIEGAVQVAALNGNSTLHAGDQTTTSDNMGAVPVREDIAWSRDRAKHVELLAQFAQLQHKLEQVQMPAPRFTSNLVDRVPADTVFYASIPNLGQALSEANTIFQNQLAQSAVLREWWTRGNAREGRKLNEAVDHLRQLSEYLGDEVLLVGFNGQQHSDFAVIAEVRRSGLKDALPLLLPKDERRNLLVVNEQQLKGLNEANAGKHSIALVRDDVFAFSAELGAIQRVNEQLNAGPSSFLRSEFGTRISDSYNRGAGFLIAADLQSMIENARRYGSSRNRRGFDQTGFSDMRYLIAEHREVNGTPDNRLVLDFAGQRHGVSSWLAAPAPMGALEFVSRNAGLAVSIVAKDPQLMFDDMLAMATAEGRGASDHIAEAESKLRLRLRDDVAAHFGGDAVVALDGPVLPTPAWKFIVEVHDPAGLQASIEKLIAASNDEARQHGREGLILQQEDVQGQHFYSVQHAGVPAATSYYTYSNGYMIVAQSRAFIIDSLRTHATGDSLARSADFKRLLPNDGHQNYSAILYQNLAPILQPLVSTLNTEKASVIQQLAGDSRPSVICAVGDQSSITASSNSRLFGFDWLALASLLDSGTERRPKT